MWVKCVAGILIAFELLNTELKGKKKISIKQYTPVVLLFLMLITSFWSVDWSKNIEGILTGVILFGWMLLWRATDDDKKGKLIAYIPYTGVAMVVISILPLLIENFPVQLWQAQRLGGFFQYSNTCALFLGLCIMIQDTNRTEGKGNKLSLKKTRTKKSVKNEHLYEVIAYAITISILVIGLLLTGSRGMLLLMFCWAIYKIIKDKKQRKEYAVVITVLVAFIIIVAALGRNSQNLGRLASILSSNSTIWGRLLYYIDGLKMLITHPFGMGYRGYYYVQGSMQTGVYTTMFVHNEILQMGLDYGIVAMILLVVYLLVQLIEGKQEKACKEYLLMIIAASLMDFNLQYMAILMMVVMCLDLNTDLKFYENVMDKIHKTEANKIHKTEANKIHKTQTNTTHKTSKTSTSKSKSQSSTVGILICFAALVCMVYWLIVYGTFASGSYDASGKVFGYNTEVLEKQLIDTTSTTKAMELADKILGINKYSFTAWYYRAYACQQLGDYDEMIACENKLMEINRYNIEVYKKYDNFISNILENDENANIEPVKSQLLKEQQSIPDKLRSLENETNSLAYKIKDQPVFEYNNEE